MDVRKGFRTKICFANCKNVWFFSNPDITEYHLTKEEKTIVIWEKYLAIYKKKIDFDTKIFKTAQDWIMLGRVSKLKFVSWIAKMCGFFLIRISQNIIWQKQGQTFVFCKKYLAIYKKIDFGTKIFNTALEWMLGRVSKLKFVSRFAKCVGFFSNPDITEYHLTRTRIGFCNLPKNI